MNDASRGLSRIGDRPRLGLVHGMLDRPTVWQKIETPLRERFSVTAPEFPWGPASGASAPGAPDSVFHRLGESLPGVVVAHSRGAYEVVRHVLATGVNRTLLVLVGWSNQTPTRMREVVPENGPPLLEMCRSLVTDRMTAEGAAISEIRRDWLAGFAVPRFDAWDRNVWLDPRDLRTMACPTLLVYGDEDRTLTGAEIDRLAEALPDVEIASLAGTAHWPMLERPEALVRTVLDFVARRRT